MTGKIAASDEAKNNDEEEVDMSGKYGHPKEYDEKFKGPIEKRGCTDIICLLMLIAFIVGWFIIAGIAFTKGDPSFLIHPVDSLGKKCGLDEGVENKPYLYFFDITRCATPKVIYSGCKTPQVCVEKCPEEPWALSVERTRIGSINYEELKKKLICKYDVDLSNLKDFTTLEKLITQKKCASYLLPSKSRNLTTRGWRRSPIKNFKSIFASRCIPDLTAKEENFEEINRSKIQEGINKLLEFLNAKENVKYLFEDFKASWHIILIVLVIGAIISLLWICALRCFAGVMVWVSLIGMLVVLSYSTYFSVAKYIELRNENHTENGERYDGNTFISQEEFEAHVDSYLKLQNTWLAFAIIAGTLLCILLLIVIFIRSRISIAVALIKQGAKAVGDMTFTLLWPIIPLILQLIVIGFFIIVGIHLVSAGEQVNKISTNCTCGTEKFYEDQKCNPSTIEKMCPNGTATTEDDCNLLNACQFVYLKKLTHGIYFHLYNFFGLLWLLCFINDLDDMVLAGSFAGWYWTFNKKKDLKMFPVSNSFSRTLRYHLGTIAFGSLIISIIKFIRFFLEYIDYKLRQYPENPVAKAFLCCCRCCFWCLEKFMKFINRNAYIMCAVYGKNFCSSAKDAFFLLLRNALRAFVLDKVTDFLLLIGKLAIVGGVSIGSFYIFTERTEALKDFVPELNFYLMPVIVIAIGTYFIATLFFEVYAMAVDTLFLCFLEDCERHDGTQEKPYYMPKELMEILGKKNKKE